MCDFASAWSYYSLATSAAQGAGQPDGEAAILARTSFLFIYSTNPYETPPEALFLLERAQQITGQSSTLSLRARLAAIKAEIHVNLGQIDACRNELDLAEDLVQHLRTQNDVVPDTILSFDRAVFAGYKGVCQLRMGRPLDALVTLEEARQLYE